MRGTLRRLAATKGGPPALLYLSKLAHPISVRPGTNDIETILNNVIREEYAHALPDWSPKIMIDAGAFIGDTSAYFLSRYPALSVIALEPEPHNFDLARANLAPYGNRVRLLPKALAGRLGTVKFAGESVSGSVQAAGIEVAALSMSDLLDADVSGKVDILKMDIEGAELDVFRSEPGSWLPHVDMIIAELHGKAITAEVRAILGGHGFKAVGYRSLTFFRRPDGGMFA